MRPTKSPGSEFARCDSALPQIFDAVAMAPEQLDQPELDQVVGQNMHLHFELRLCRRSSVRGVRLVDVTTDISRIFEIG